jgi:glyoxylase-like metal-dependent hydrolase (beta-lactamase superfamily II)
MLPACSDGIACMPEKYIRIGEFRCFPLSDGHLRYPKQALFPNQTDTEMADALAPEPVEPQIRVGYSGLLVDTGRERILIDTGAGTLGPDTGRLPESVDVCGFTPEEIDIVVLSHMHPDHIGGLMSGEKRFRFPNAEVVASRTEHDFWTSEENQAKLKSMALFGLGHIEEVMLGAVQNNIPPLVAAGRLRLVEGDHEPVPGMQILPAFGHTPGHLAVLISSGRQQLLYGADAIIHPAHVKHPDWKTVFDVLPEQAVMTRRQLLDRSASDRCLTFHYHFPFPCIGSVSRWNGGYQWEPMPL